MLVRHGFRAKGFGAFELGYCVVTGKIKRFVSEGYDGVKQYGGRGHAE